MINDAHRRWAMSLALLVTPDRQDETAELLSKMAAMLSDMPIECFTSKTCLDAVVCAKRYSPIPPYDVIRSAMQAWLAETRPYRTALPAPRIPDRAEPTSEAHEYVRKLVAGMTAETKAREQATAQKLREERPAYAPKVFSRETLNAMYRKDGRSGPQVAE